LGTEPAQEIFLSRRIHTMASAQPAAQAIAVRNGRIMAIGSKDVVMGLKGNATKVIDFGDLTVLPGFVDPHMHSNFCGLRPWLDVGPFTTKNMEEALAKIAKAAKMIVWMSRLSCIAFFRSPKANLRIRA
jgi:predicted amidohydrolase YtcJ